MKGMKDLGSWKPVEVRTNAGLRKYKNEPVVIISGGKSSGRIYLTDATLALLDDPKAVFFFERSSSIAICNAEQVTNPDPSWTAVKVTTVSRVDYYKMVASRSLLNGRNIRPGVYVTHTEQGMVVFDTASAPSRP